MIGAGMDLGTVQGTFSGYTYYNLMTTTMSPAGEPTIIYCGRQLSATHWLDLRLRANELVQQSRRDPTRKHSTPMATPAAECSTKAAL